MKSSPMKIVPWDGKKISKPGVYRGVSLDVYHSGKLCVGPSISSSGLRTIFNDSPAHYWAYSRLNPKRFEKDESPALTLGRAVHHVLLGEPAFKKQFVIRPEEAPDGRAWNGNNKSCRQWLEDRAKEGLTVLKEADVETIRGMAMSLSKESLVTAGALNGAVECTFAWEDQETGVWMLARPDNTSLDSEDFVDLKTTTSVQYPDLVRSLDEFSYCQQGALVADGYLAITGRSITSFSLYFIEKTPPYCADLRQLTAEDLERGRKMNRIAVRTFAKCFNSGVWPGPAGIQSDASYIDLSGPARARIDKRISQELERADG